MIKRGVVAKKINGKNNLRKLGYLVFDVKDF